MKINGLNQALPDIFPFLDLKKESATSHCGPCPLCGGVDRFVLKTDTGKCWCRHCHPEAMDKIDFHCWKDGKSVSDLMREYLPDDADAGHQGDTRQPTPHDLFSKRGLADEVIRVLTESRGLKVTAHAGKQCVAVPYTTLDGETKATQYITIDQGPFPFTEQSGKPANKVFRKGDKPGSECFFIAGPDVNQADELIISESVINAGTTNQLRPGACCIALGGSTYTRKVSALKPYLDGVKRVIVCQDNDEAGDKMAQSVHKILGDKVHRLVWGPDDPPGHDINDLLQAGQDERGRAMIEGAVRIERPKIEIISLAEIIELDPQIEPIAEGLINRREPVIVHAAGGVGKSTLAHQIALELAMPTNMYGNMLLETFPIRQTGRQSLFIQSENSMATINAKSRGCDPDAVSKIFFPKIHNDILTTGGAFEEPEFCNLVMEFIDAIQNQTGNPVDLLFVDPLISFNRAEENGAGDMRAALDGITDVMQKTGVTPIVLHHDRKEGDDYRGSTAINDWCRCRVHLKRKFIGEDRITELTPDDQPIMRTAKIPAIEMVHTKANNMALFEPFTMVLNKKLKFVKVDDPIDPDVKENIMIVQQALHDMGGESPSNIALAKTVSELTGKSINTCKGYIVKAVDHEYITAIPTKDKNGKGNSYSYALQD